MFDRPVGVKVRSSAVFRAAAKLPGLRSMHNEKGLRAFPSRIILAAAYRDANTPLWNSFHMIMLASLKETCARGHSQLIKQRRNTMKLFYFLFAAVVLLANFGATFAEDEGDATTAASKGNETFTTFCCSILRVPMELFPRLSQRGILSSNTRALSKFYLFQDARVSNVDEKVSALEATAVLQPGGFVCVRWSPGSDAGAGDRADKSHYHRLRSQGDVVRNSSHSG